jgi:hypothetical protein
MVSNLLYKLWTRDQSNGGELPRVKHVGHHLHDLRIPLHPSSAAHKTHSLLERAGEDSSRVHSPVHPFWLVVYYLERGL